MGIGGVLRIEVTEGGKACVWRHGIRRRRAALRGSCRRCLRSSHRRSRCHQNGTHRLQDRGCVRCARPGPPPCGPSPGRSDVPGSPAYPLRFLVTSWPLHAAGSGNRLQRISYLASGRGLIIAQAGIFSMRLSQPCRYVVNTDRSGGGNEGSANAPTPTPISCGMGSGSQNTVDPHSGTKMEDRVLSCERVAGEGLRSAIDNGYRAMLDKCGNAKQTSCPAPAVKTMAHRNAQVSLATEPQFAAGSTGETFGHAT